MKNLYNKPCLQIENFVPNVSISSCTCRVTFRGNSPRNVYYDSDGDGYYDRGEEYTNNLGNSNSATIDIAQNKELGYILKASSDNAAQGIQAGDLRMRSLNNSTYDFYTTKSSSNKYLTSNYVCAVLGTDGRMYFTDSPAFVSVTNKTFS